MPFFLKWINHENNSKKHLPPTNEHYRCHDGTIFVHVFSCFQVNQWSSVNFSLNRFSWTPFLVDTKLPDVIATWHNDLITDPQKITYEQPTPEASIIGVIRLPNNISDFTLSINKEVKNCWTWIKPAIADWSLWYRRVFNAANFCTRLLVLFRFSNF